MADFYKDNYKEGMTVYLLYTGYDLCVGKYAPRKKYSITEGIISEMGKNYLKVSTEGQKICFRFNEKQGRSGRIQEKVILYTVLKSTAKKKPLRRLHSDTN